MRQGSVIHVDEVASRIASFYEKVRKIIDYQEEHLLRKRFIGRALSRRLALSYDAAIAEPLIKDIVRAGHLPNDSVPEAKVEEVQEILDRFYGIKKALVSSVDPKERKRVEKWLHRLLASEIEECLFSPAKDMMLARAMFQTLKRHLVVQGEVPGNVETDNLLFIAVQRALLRVDEDQLNYRLLKFIRSDWGSAGPERHAEVAASLPGLYQKVRRLIRDPFQRYFFSLANRYNTVFYVLGDIVESTGSVEEFENVISDEAKFDAALEAAYRDRVAHSKDRLRRLGFLIVLSFFISKIAIAILVEIPIEVYLTGEFSRSNMAMNIVIPPLLMYFISSSIRYPSKKNLGLLLKEAKASVWEAFPSEYIVKVPRERSPFVLAILNTAYIATFIVSLYVLWVILRAVGFNLANAAVFAAFVSLVAAAGVKVHNRARELIIEERKGTFFSFILDLFAVPFVRIGKWIIAGISKFNIFIVIFNVLVEVPVQVLVQFVEEFGGFLRSKKEEVG